MDYLFLDESGDSSFAGSSIYTHFLITIISVDQYNRKRIRTQLRREFSGLINRGWDKTREIKAADVFNERGYGSEAIVGILKRLVTIKSLTVNYIVVNKEKIARDSFKKAPYGIAYNYFTGIILSDLIFGNKLYKVHMIYDKRNKETHENKPFKEYLQTLILGSALEKKLDVEFIIQGHDSSNWYGLLAADFFSWAIFRKFEHRDDRFFKIFRHKIKRKKEWYT